MWTDTTRKQHARNGLRLPSDLTDEEWAVLEPLLPKRSRLGRPPHWSQREIVEAMLYLLRGGLSWRMLPPGIFPPATTVQHYFYAWRDAGLWTSINHALVMLAREAAGREASPTAGVIDSYPWLRHVFADGGYAGKKLKATLAKIGQWTVQIVKRTGKAKGFVVIPRRWVVERTFAWLGRNRRLAKDFERTVESATAWLVMASVQMITRRIASV